jgi:hypothetical protein
MQETNKRQNEREMLVNWGRAVVSRSYCQKFPWNVVVDSVSLSSSLLKIFIQHRATLLAQGVGRCWLRFELTVHCLEVSVVQLRHVPL